MGIPISFSPSRLSVFTNIAPSNERTEAEEDKEIKWLQKEILVHLIAFDKFRQNSLFPAYSTKEEEHCVISFCFSSMNALAIEASPLLQKELKALLSQSEYNMHSLEKLMISYCRVKKRERTILETGDPINLVSQILEYNAQLKSLETSLREKRTKYDNLSMELSAIDIMLKRTGNKSELFKEREPKQSEINTLNFEIFHLSREISSLTRRSSKLNHAIIGYRSLNRRRLSICHHHLQSYETSINRSYLKNIETLKRLIEINSIFSQQTVNSYSQ